MALSSQSFCYNNERKKDSRLEPLSVWSWYLLPMSMWVFSRGLWFPPTSLRRACEVRGTSVESLGVGKVSALHGRASHPGLGPNLHPALPGWALATHNPELESTGWKIIILRVFIHLS